MKNEVRFKDYTSDSYLSQADMKNVLECLPPSLIDLLQLLSLTDIAKGSILTKYHQRFEMKEFYINFFLDKVLQLQEVLVMQIKTATMKIVYFTNLQLKTLIPTSTHLMARKYFMKWEYVSVL